MRKPGQSGRHPGLEMTVHRHPGMEMTVHRHPGPEMEMTVHRQLAARKQF